MCFYKYFVMQKIKKKTNWLRNRIMRKEFQVIFSNYDGNLFDLELL